MGTSAKLHIDVSAYLKYAEVLTVKMNLNQNSVRRKQKTTVGKCDISSLFEETA